MKVLPPQSRDLTWFNEKVNYLARLQLDLVVLRPPQ